MLTNTKWKEVLVSSLLFMSLSCSFANGETEGLSEASNNRIHRGLGSITNKVNSGTWLEFESDAVVGSLAYGCDPVSSYCSVSSNSEAIGVNNTSPWSFTSSCWTQLTVMEGYSSGDSIFEVFDNGVSLGNTSQGTTGYDCEEDPSVCWGDTKVGKGQWTLAPGSHSIQIKVMYQEWYGDGGWLQLKTMSCPASANPTKAPIALPKAPSKKPTSKPNKSPTKKPTFKPTKLPTKKPTKQPTKAPINQLPACLASTKNCNLQSTNAQQCCSGLVCRRNKLPSGTPQCLACRGNGQRCEANRDCCSASCVTSTTNSSTKYCRKKRKKL